MKITKMQSLVAEFASKSTVRPELSCILHDGITTVATDSFRLVEIKNIGIDDSEVAIPELIKAKDIIAAKIKTSGDTRGTFIDVPDKNGAVISYPLHTPEADPKDYPKYNYLFEEKGLKDCIEIDINGEYLASIAETLAKLNGSGKITVRIPKASNTGIRFIELRSNGMDHEARALLAPMIR